ncbi:MAG: hypothetical protein KBT04_07065, partial [Bacteroidales bacterium]|nr:hypothetical protein [Candidatus Colimorpha onthohippi]
LVLGGSVSVIKGWGSTPYQLRGREPHNRTPYRHQQLTSFSFEGTYQFNKNLTIAASLFYVDGYWNSMLCSSLNPTRVSMLGFEGLLSYQFGNNTRLEIYFSYLRGEGMPLGLYSPWYYSFLTHNHNMRFHHYMNMGWY